MSAFDSNWIMSTEATTSSGSASNNKSSSSGRPESTIHATFAPSATSLPQQTSPLLSSTPPTVTKALSQAYPFILAADHVLALLTWTSGDSWQSFLVVAIYTAIVLYFEVLVRYFGHLLAVGGIAGYVWLNNRVEQEQTEHPTLDAIVHTLTNVVTRLNLFLQPITSLSLTTHDVTRLLLTTLFLSPIHMILAFFVFSPRSLLLLGGAFVLTYHSVWARVTRTVLWRSRTVRLLTFYLTGLDFSGTRHKNLAEVQQARTSTLGVQTKDGKPVKFTFVLYENQRRWLGIGWTGNLLAYERTPWTDEFLNESAAPDSFKLPDAEGTGMVWKWVDANWKLDMSNDGSLVLNSSQQKLSVDPGANDGFIYYDNTWKKPSAEDSFSKYTRRRRWVRTAELISLDADGFAETAQASSSTTESESVVDLHNNDSEDTSSTGVAQKAGKTQRRKKSLRFED
ncbi:hypothetical protein TRVA0_030S01552 [Trichomonascus vanleenenianus]|uniref:peroxisome biogenesis protein n=1 Tax=Trichomonascus vanleenenianus TaxID=2268995 RepID=UPI003ECB32EB